VVDEYTPRSISDLIARQLSSRPGASEGIEVSIDDPGCDWVSIERLMQGAETVAGMVIKSTAARRVLKMVTRFSGYRATVLIQGESGTGKELVARALHTMGHSSSGPFVTFNCSNLVESLAESQLFGHVRGAFTDAREDALGYFRSAAGGTLFLDEIGELPLHLQPKLLRAVETHEVQPVGATRSYRVDLRLVAATNRDLREMVRSGTFRDDLYYRLHAATITVPALRTRTEDIAALTGHFMAHYNRLLGHHVRYISRRALKVLLNHNWPGNVRELSHAIENAVMMSDEDRIDVSALPEYLLEPAPPETAPNIHDVAEQAQSSSIELEAEGGAVSQWPLELDEVIKRTLVRSLQETAGNRRRAADLLGISRSTLYRMMSRYGLENEPFRRNPQAAHPRVRGPSRGM
jgi:DNA-binding NtrC family response regulator